MPLRIVQELGLRQMTGRRRFRARGYLRDNVGHIKKITGSQASDDIWNYDYDFRDRLITASFGRYPGKMSESFTYDASGNLTLRDLSSADVAMAYNNSRPHAISSLNGSAAYVYDSNGNLTNDRVRLYEWDPANRLKTVTTSGLETLYVYGP